MTRLRLVPALLVLQGCTLRRALLIESAVPARIQDARSGEVLCARTPCRITVDRPWPFDSSLHYMLLRAVAPDGAVEERAIDTHQVRSGQVLRFAFKQAERPADR